MDISFVKMEGIGNDFILLDDREGFIGQHTAYPELSVKLCSRHFGIGADGILLILNSEDHDMKFRIYNSDGSQAQMCGNGMRCFAKYLFENNLVEKKQIRVDTKAGTVIPEVIVNQDGGVDFVRVDMGEPVLSCSEIPFISENETSVEESLDADGVSYRITPVSMGNPHAVIFVDDVDRMDLEKEGRAIETHGRFPEKTNVEFIEVLSASELRMRVWERGAGITLACGTGACAALVAASLTGRSDDSARVHLTGGSLDISWDRQSNHVFKTGPARQVFEGRIRI